MASRFHSVSCRLVAETLSCSEHHVSDVHLCLCTVGPGRARDHKRAGTWFLDVDILRHGSLMVYIVCNIIDHFLIKKLN